jgi:hypothetical protein
VAGDSAPDGAKSEPGDDSNPATTTRLIVTAFFRRISWQLCWVEKPLFRTEGYVINFPVNFSVTKKARVPWESIIASTAEKERHPATGGTKYIFPFITGFPIRTNGNVVSWPEIFRRHPANSSLVQRNFNSGGLGMSPWPLFGPGPLGG